MRLRRAGHWVGGFAGTAGILSSTTSRTGRSSSSSSVAAGVMVRASCGRCHVSRSQITIVGGTHARVAGARARFSGRVARGV